MSFGKHVIAAAVLVVGVPAPARAAAFSAGYTCSVPVLGARPVTVAGALAASPYRPVAGRPVHFQLHI
jgi:hypothetical protein